MAPSLALDLAAMPQTAEADDSDLSLTRPWTPRVAGEIRLRPRRDLGRALGNASPCWGIDTWSCKADNATVTRDDAVTPCPHDRQIDQGGTRDLAFFHNNPCGMLTIDVGDYGLGSAGLIDESQRLVVAESGLCLRPASEAQLLQESAKLQRDGRALMANDRALCCNLRLVSAAKFGGRDEGHLDGDGLICLSVDGSRGMAALLRKPIPKWLPKDSSTLKDDVTQKLSSIQRAAGYSAGTSSTTSTKAGSVEVEMP